MSIDTVPMEARPTRLAAIVLVLAAGVLTGAQLGKIAPLIPWYRAEIGLSLVAVGWLAAVLGIFIALAALPAGWAIARIGLYRSILMGAAALVLGGVALALAASPVAIFAARLVEAVGYLLLCIALPAMLNDISPPSWKGPVLAIWSGFVPLGFAVSDYLAAAALPTIGEPSYLLVMVALLAVFSGAALLLLRGATTSAAEQETDIRASLTVPVVLVAISFGAFVVLSVSMFTFMPVFIAGEGAHYLVLAGTIALAVPLGNVLASVLVRGRDVAFMGRLAVMGFMISALTAVPAFTLQSPLPATLSAFAFAVSGALVSSTQFAAIPFITPRGGSVPVAMGLVCQAGGIGTLFGPPLAATVIEAYGWAGFGWFLAATSLAGLACMIPLMRAERQALSPS